MLNQDFHGGNRDYAVAIVRSVCCLAGDPEFLAHRRTGRQKSLASIIARHDTPRLFDWLVEALSYQGIADKVAYEYMRRHGRARFASIEASLARRPSCPKLKSYWHFEDCRYQKSAEVCSQPDHIADCPLPALPLRNGHLNQMAYSLFLFIRDVADGDLVTWIEAQLAAADNPAAPDRLEAMRVALLEPLRCIYGVSDKVLSVALADLLLGAGQRRPRWAQVGARMIAVDRLVHNFLQRTGILRRLDAEHAYGPACYGPERCVGIIGLIAAEIDTRQFNPAFPATFPRFVQSAIWRYCAESGLAICNGNRIDDAARCENRHCHLFRRCDRIALHAEREKTLLNQ